MSWYARVVWSEGMFLRPQHFQQNQRFIERFIEDRCKPVASYPWGLTALRIDPDQLSVGKIVISTAIGVFPDGTPFSVPDHDTPPPAIDIPENTHNTEVFLGIPIRREAVTEVLCEDNLTPARQLAWEIEARDISSPDTSPASIHVSGLNLRLLTADDDRGDYSCLGIARIIESRANKNVIFDDAFIPTVIHCDSAVQLKGFLDEIERLLKHRGEALCGRVVEAGRGGNAEISDFLLLQVVNRYLPLLGHFRRDGRLHPEAFYCKLLEIAGELATFTKTEKTPETFPEYRHEDLRATFEPVMRDLRQSLSMVLDRSAIQIPLQDRKYGVRVGSVFDRRLLVEATFCLVVRANMSAEEIRRIFPTQVKIGPVEKIRDLVNLALPGILITPLPVAPRQLPFRSGAVYFELDRSSEFWKQLHNSGGFAIHVSGEFPAIDMEFWAIRG